MSQASSGTSFSALRLFMGKRIVLVVLCQMVAGSSYARNYIEAGASILSYENTAFSGSKIDNEQQIVGVLLGHEYAPNWSVEFITGIANLTNAPVRINGVEVAGLSMKFKKAFTVTVKRELPLNAHFAFAGRIGYTSVSGAGTYQGKTDSFSSSGTSYSLGVRYRLYANTYLASDYVSFIDKKDVKIKALAMGLGHRF